MYRYFLNRTVFPFDIMGNVLPIMLLQACSLLSFAYAGGGLSIFFRHPDGTHRAVEVPADANGAKLHKDVAAVIGHPCFSLSITGSTVLPAVPLADSGISAECIVEVRDNRDWSDLDRRLTSPLQQSFKQRVIDELSQYPDQTVVAEVVGSDSTTELWLSNDDREVFKVGHVGIWLKEVKCVQIQL